MKNNPIQSRLHYQFERSNGSAIHATSIAPNPGPSTLEAQGWRYVARDAEGNIVSTSNADDARKNILRSFGHKL